MDKVLYAKRDAAKLEMYLKAEQRSDVTVIKKKCLEHSKKCEACDILSRRQESNRESALIKDIWSNIQAEPGPNGEVMWQKRGHIPRK